MKYLTFLSRFVVGVLFIISGLIKANDALGFSYKLEEYFSADVLNLEFLMPMALFLAASICIVEIVLGVMVLIGSRPKLTSWSLLGMIVFFTFLTFYSAYFNKVTDCGCFGDAIKLTPWGSFYKDIILLFFIMIIFKQKDKIQPLFNLKKENMLNAIVIFFSITFVYHTYTHLPIKDFRPYAIGNNLVEGMKTCEELELPCREEAYYYIVKDKASGQESELLSTEYLQKWQVYDFVEATEKVLVLEEGYDPPVKDFSISSQGYDFTDQVLEAELTFLVVNYNVKKSNKEVYNKINAFYDACLLDSISVYSLSASSDEDINEFKHETASVMPFYFTDETTLKTIVRSNPGLVMLKKGTVVGKWHFNDFPNYQDIKIHF